MKKVAFLTPFDARYGFSTAGASQRTAGPGEATTALRAALADPDTGLVIVDERLVAEIGEEQFRTLEKRWHGILVVLPAPAKERPAEDYAIRLIRRAIGYHVRIEL